MCQSKDTSSLKVKNCKIAYMWLRSATVQRVQRFFFLRDYFAKLSLELVALLKRSSEFYAPLIGRDRQSSNTAITWRICVKQAQVMCPPHPQVSAEPPGHKEIPIFVEGQCLRARRGFKHISFFILNS